MYLSMENTCWFRICGVSETRKQGLETGPIASSPLMDFVCYHHLDYRHEK